MKTATTAMLCPTMAAHQPASSSNIGTAQETVRSLTFALQFAETEHESLLEKDATMEI